LTRSRLGIAIAAVFRVGEASLSREAGFEMFSEALQGFTPGRDVGLIEKGWRVWAEYWTRGRPLSVSYAGDPRLDGRELSISIFWAGKEYVHRNEPFKVTEGEPYPPTLGLNADLYAGERLAVFALHTRELQPSYDPCRAINFFAERMVEVFDVLKPSIGMADTYERVGFDRKADPFAKVHWMEFIGPEHPSLMEKLRSEDVMLDERPWGGLVVRRWDDPLSGPGKK
jgi:hypothetical protein